MSFTKLYSNDKSKTLLYSIFHFFYSFFYLYSIVSFLHLLMLSCFVFQIFGSAFCAVVPPRLTGLLGLAVACGYQYMLIGPPALEGFVLHGYDGNDTRQGFLNANREGLFSCCGYLSIYFIGVQLGAYIFKPRCD